MKQFLSDRMLGICQRRYNNSYEKKICSYDTWIRKKEAAFEREREAEEKQTNTGTAVITFIPFEVADVYCKELEKSFRSNTGTARMEEVTIFVSGKGQVAEWAKELIGECFIENEQLALVYADEDVISPEGIRYTPWLKPDWSPDTFLSCFYFGNIFAVKTSELQGFEWEEQAAEDVNLYRLCLHILNKKGAFEKRTDVMSPVKHLPEVLFHSYSNREMEIAKAVKSERDQKRTAAVSVIIPSKDQPELLSRCISSLKKELIPGDEILVVDNGSSPENQEKIKSFLDEAGGSYLYHPMEFQFSVMCNLAAERAGNEVLLFLNDDVEVPEEQWLLSTVVCQALRPYAGAVGVKLLYPENKLIQHAGIVNQKLGPVHKLQFKDDNTSYYYGWNRGMRNVIAVTGACLAVKKEKFQEAGGFPEELAIAFNDVALCFSLYEKGYYNVVCQDVKLLHHESLSRGRDEDSGKLKRLLREKELLYQRHPGMEGRDPFYHKYFAQSILTTGFETGAEYESMDGFYQSGLDGTDTKKRIRLKTKVKSIDGLPAKARQDACLMISIETAEAVNKEGGKHSQRNCYMIQGYAFVAGSDNARYKKYILLNNNDFYYRITPEVCLRREVEENLPDQQNVGLCGFAAVIESGRIASSQRNSSQTKPSQTKSGQPKSGQISPGSYRIGVLAVDCCSGSSLVNWTGRIIEIVG